MVQDSTAYERMRAMMHETCNALVCSRKWTKLLKAFAMLYGLEHMIKVDDEGNVVINVIVKNAWYESVIDVFEEGRIACVSSLSKYIFASAKPLEDVVEAASKEILEGTFGEGRYLESMKGGGYQFLSGRQVGKNSFQLVEVPYFIVKDLPRSLDELLIRLDIANIRYDDLIVNFITP